MVSFTPQLLYPQGSSSRYPLDTRLGGFQRRSGRGDKEKNFLPIPGIEPRSSNPYIQEPVCSVAYKTTEMKFAQLFT